MIFIPEIFGIYWFYGLMMDFIWLLKNCSSLYVTRLKVNGMFEVKKGGW